MLVWDGALIVKVVPDAEASNENTVSSSLLDGIVQRTTNPIESTFATVRLRKLVTKGPGSWAAGIAMAFKLSESARRRLRAVNSAHLVALLRAGAKFENGVLVECPDESASGDTHAP